jgi:hypothetical protein
VLAAEFMRAHLAFRPAGKGQAPIMQVFTLAMRLITSRISPYGAKLVDMLGIRYSLARWRLP